MAALNLSVIFGMVDRITRPLQGLDRRLTASSRALNELTGQLRTATRAGDADAIARINAQLERQRRLTERLAGATRSYNNVTRLQQGLASGGAKLLAAGTAGAFAGSKVVGAFTENESAETDLKTAMMRADGSVPEEFEKINKLANELGNKLPGTTADFQLMMRELTNQGISFQSILGGTGEAAAYMAVQMKMPFSEAAAFTAKMLDATQGSEKEILGLMDSIQKGMHLGLSSNDMLNAIAAVAPALSTLKKKGKEAADVLMPLIVMAGQNELSGGAAGNAFNKIIGRSIDKKAITKANKELRGTGIKIDFTDGKGEFGGLEKMFKELNKLKKLNSQQRNAYLKAQFGDDSETNQALGIMMDKGFAGYNDTIAKMEAQASLQQRVNAQLSTLANLWDAAGGTFTNLLAHWGSLLAPELKALTAWLTDMTEKIINWSNANPKIAKTIAMVAGALVFLSIGGGLLALMIAGLLGPLKLLMTLFGVSAFPIIVALAGIAASIYLIYKYWDDLVWLFTEGFSEISTDIGNLLGEIPFIGTYLKDLWKSAGTIFSYITKGLGEIVDLFLDWDNTINGINFLWEELSATVGAFWDDLEAKASKVIDYVTKKIQPLIDAVKKVTDFAGITGGQTETAAKEAASSAHEKSKTLLKPGQYSEEVPTFGTNQPGQVPVLAGNNTTNQTVNVTQYITSTDPKQAAAEANKNLAGATKLKDRN